MWEHPRTQPVHTQSAVAQSHYSACYWPLSHSAAQHWISQPKPASLPLWGIHWLLDFLRLLVSHSLPPFPPLSSLLRALCLSFLGLPPSPPRCLSFSLILSLSVLPLLLLCMPFPVSLPSLSPLAMVFYGQQKTLFSSLLSTGMAKLPIHLLRLLYSLPCLQNPLQLQSLHK